MTGRDLACTQFRRNWVQITIKGYWSYWSFYGVDIFLVFSWYQARRCAAHFRIWMQWNGRLSPSLTGPRVWLAIRCCSKSWINAYSSIAPKFMPQESFSWPLYDLPSWTRRNACQLVPCCAPIHRNSVYFNVIFSPNNQLSFKPVLLGVDWIPHIYTTFHWFFWITLITKLHKRPLLLVFIW